jgi:HAD superfamily hydrolase (TIGR01509 family)
VIPQFPVYLFDIDGTLLDSAQDICGAIQQALFSTSAASRPAAAKDATFDYLKGFVGFPLIDLFLDLFPDHSTEQIDDLIQGYRTFYHARRHRNTKPYPGVAEALAALGGRKSTATTKGTPTTRAVLEQFGLIHYFDHVQGTDGMPFKPAPDVLLAALAALHAAPADCLFVGDSPADMEAGRRAGVRTCAVRYGYGKTEELEKWAPDYWVSDLRELLQKGTGYQNE